MATWVLNFTKSGTKDKKQLVAQARELLEVGLWGIPPGNPMKDKMKPGDQVLAFVGAPERRFVGDAALATGWHQWTPDEEQLYPAGSTFSAGVALKDAHVWAQSLQLSPVWEKTQAAKTNPNARWYGGIVSLTDADGQLILDAGQGGPTGEVTTPEPPSVTTPPRDSSSAASTFFQATEALRAVPPGTNLSEQKTRWYFIDKYVAALGYTGVEDLDMGDAVASGSVPDYVLRANGKPAVALEAKSLGSSLGAKEAGQVVQYCGGLGVRWGLLTDGRYFKLFDAPVLGKAPEERLVF